MKDENMQVDPATKGNIGILLVLAFLAMISLYQPYTHNHAVC